MLFQETIRGWEDWGRLFQSRAAFAPLVQAICEKQRLPFEPFLNCVPGTNAVFEAGGQIVKVFAPIESGLDTLPDYCSERFGLQRTKQLGLRAPRLLAAGEIRDRYLFRYLVMEKISGMPFIRAKTRMDEREKRRIGRQLREIVARMDTPCAPWSEPVDLKKRALENERFAPFPESFNRERRAFTETIPLENPVYVHGDLNGDNLLIEPDGTIALIDFADAVLAPAWYEHALIASELFCFEQPFLLGYFGEYSPEELAQLCIKGLLLHDFGGDILRIRLGDIESLYSLDLLRDRLIRRLSGD